MKELHTDDLSMNSGKLFREQMVENFKVIEQAINDESDQRSEGDNNLQGEIDKANQRCDSLENTRATHDEVHAAKDTWKAKIEHVALGTDYETVEKAVEQILQKKGLI
ncbi:hypothetical protein [Limosilactobacillus reuteri]|uniref:hypothetical protein n=1 Tax=Limosilactobacillus reuteri TaxID=1598 RepID=UPI001E472929|nr:hypothetical protein [Limosilactobacillus reuteri]